MRNPKHRLKLYRRHIDGCKAKSDLNCHCPLWVYGHIHGKPIRQSLETRDITAAERRTKIMLSEPGETTSDNLQSIEESMALFLAAARGRNRSKNTLEVFERNLHATAAF